jgi:hypothetical protein
MAMFSARVALFHIIGLRAVDYPIVYAVIVALAQTGMKN